MSELTSNPSQLLESVIKLRTQIYNADNLSDEVLEQVRQLDKKMHRMLDSNELMAEENLADSIMDLETHFASAHPQLEKFIREMVERLSQMGI